MGLKVAKRGQGRAAESRLDIGHSLFELIHDFAKEHIGLQA
jgi:5-carboxymethyl-2-hydroxymuconate isomerase